MSELVHKGARQLAVVKGELRPATLCGLVFPSLLDRESPRPKTDDDGTPATCPFCLATHARQQAQPIVHVDPWATRRRFRCRR